jgi:hypothetical protein
VVGASHFSSRDGRLGGSAGATMKREMPSSALTSAVEHIALQLEIMHSDIKDDRRETFKRLNEMEQRVSKLEAHPRQ